MPKSKLMWSCRRLFLWGTFLSVLVAVNCTPELDGQLSSTPEPVQPGTVQPTSPESAIQPQATTTDILHDWLYGIPCRPPCWLGITPGQTLATDAQAILQGNPSITTVRVATGTRGHLYWDSYPLQESGRVDFQGATSVVTAIYVGQDGSLTMQDIINIYGVPSHVYASALPCTDRSCTVYSLYILFLGHGFALTWNQKASRPDFGPDWRGFDVLFFEPTPEGFATACRGTVAVDLLTPWQGMLGFDAYCTGSACE